MVLENRDRRIAASLVGGVALLLFELRFEHREVLGETWRSWIPLMYCGLTLLAGGLALLRWRSWGRRAPAHCSPWVPRSESNMRKAMLICPLVLAACGGSGTSSTSATISLQAAGISPSTISVVGGSSLQFVNSDVVDHRVESNDCAELTSPTLSAGASFTATVGAGPKTCNFDDALQPSATSFHGTVNVQGAGDGNPYGP